MSEVLGIPTSEISLYLREGLALPAYEEFHGGRLRFNMDFPNLELTPNKPNSARTIIPVKYEDVSLDMYAIVFKPGDGTGDENTYSLGSLSIPNMRCLKGRNKNPRVLLPRSKAGIAYEGIFPLFSIGEYIYWFASSLKEITVDNVEKPRAIKRAGILGQTPEHYKTIIESAANDGEEILAKPEPFFTTGINETGTRFGDPHSIFYGNIGYGSPEPLQVVGFLAVSDEKAKSIEGLNDNWFFPNSEKDPFRS